MVIRKKSIKIISLSLAVLFVIGFMTGCSAIKNFRRDNDGSLWHKWTDKRFIPCSINLRAYKLGEIYGKNEKNRYYTVVNESPEDFIAEEDVIIGAVYRSSDIEEITLENFGSVAAKIYVSGGSRFLVGELLASPEIMGDISKIANYTDGTETVNAVVDAVLTGDRISYPADPDNERIFEIGLLSADYPGLVYTVLFLLDLKGNAYLYDRGEKICVKAPEIVKTYMIGDVDSNNE